MSDSHAADVQAELQQYLNSKNINALFISIVESLLIEKPSNPIAFIIEYLYKQYPEQSKSALEGLVPSSVSDSISPPTFMKLNSSASSSTPAPTPAPAPALTPAPPKQAPAPAPPAKKAPPPDSDEEDEEDDEGVADIPIKQVAPAPRGGNRRVSVSAESMDPNKLKAQRSQVTNIAKSPEVTENLLRVVAKSPLLRTLDEEQKEMIVKAFSGPVTKNPGEDVIVQGEIGETFYLLEEGFVDVYIKKGTVKVHTYKPGDSFGELALMYNAPRAATCRAQTPCKLWALDRVSFKVIVVAAAMQKREIYKGFLQQVPILSTCSEMEIMTLADALAEETYEPDQPICTQGDAGEYFYIIKSGTAVCSQVDANSVRNVVATLHEGNYFGEIALLTTKPRQATVVAQGGPLKVLSLDRATFTRVLGNMEDVLKRNMEQYNRFAAQGI